MYISQNPDGTPVVYITHAVCLANSTDELFANLVAEAQALAVATIGHSCPLRLDPTGMSADELASLAWMEAEVLS
jgi:hypothetical protein